ncbi:MAG TPA: DsrE family protein [Vicinamibacteria bacterium]|nr:DsrE family protein [Vicinamibacteria bacterium]
MADTPAEKMVIIATHGAEDPERATLPFVVANAAQVMDVKVTVILQGYSVTLAMKGADEHVFAAGLPPLKELVDGFLKQGGELLICTPCIKERRITPETLIEGAKPIAAARVVQECLEAKATLNY